MQQVTGSKLVAQVATLDALAGLLNVRSHSLKLKSLFQSGKSWNNVSAFHSSCDNKGPTIVLIRSSDGRYYGGYTSVSWMSDSAYQQDAHAFLLRLCPESGHGQQQQQHMRTEKFEILLSDHAHAQYSDSSRGPAFGAGHDLLTFTTNGLALSTTPRSYPTSGPLINSSVPKNASNFQMEVLQVTIESDGAGELELPWMKDVDWSVEVYIAVLQLAQIALPLLYTLVIYTCHTSLRSMRFPPQCVLPLLVEPCC